MVDTARIRSHKPQDGQHVARIYYLYFTRNAHMIAKGAKVWNAKPKYNWTSPSFTNWQAAYGRGVAVFA